MLHLLWMAIFGLIIGALAKLAMPGKDPGGIWITMALGIAGSLLATFVLTGGWPLRRNPKRRMDRFLRWRLHSFGNLPPDQAGQDNLGKRRS